LNAFKIMKTGNSIKSCITEKPLFFSGLHTFQRTPVPGILPESIDSVPSGGMTGVKERIKDSDTLRTWPANSRILFKLRSLKHS